MSDKTHMTLEQAIESLEKSLAIGDNLMRSKTWSGGNFKSPAIRTVLQTIKAFLEWKAKNEGGRVMSDDLENHVFDRSEYVMLSTNGPRVMLGEQKDIDATARELADRVHVAMIQTMQGNGDITAARNIGGAIISKALAAYGDECASWMRDTTESLLRLEKETHNNNRLYDGLIDLVKALPLPSEVTQ